jgi:hypothetical protein
MTTAEAVRTFLDVVCTVAVGAGAIIAVVAVSTCFIFLATHTSFLKFLGVLAALAACWVWGNFIRMRL